MTGSRAHCDVRVVSIKLANAELTEQDFLACVRDCLPYAYGLVAALAEDLSSAEREFVDNLVPPPDEQDPR